MPELPEVEEVRRRLSRAMAGVRIERVELRRQDLRGPFAADFASRLAGQTVRRVTRRAKYLLAALSSGDTLVMHLGMSGSFRVERGDETDVPGVFHYDRSRSTRHDHVLFELLNGTRVMFNDPRRFGSMVLVGPDELSTHPALAGLGPEPLSRGFDADALARALRGKTTTLKAVLLDQQVVAGLGNIYVCEALHRARLSPKRRASSMVAPGGSARPQLVALVDGIRAVLRKALKCNARYRGDDDRFDVYDREGRRCPRRGCPGAIRRIVQGGRSTYYCPVCQR